MRESASKSAMMLSGCNRWMHPAAKWYKDRPEDSEAREDGTAIHNDIHLHASGLPYNSPEHLRIKIAGAIEFYERDLLPRCEWVHTEVAYGINIHSGESKVYAVDGRDYPNDDDVLYGTADVVAKLKSGKLLIADWKSRGGDGSDEQLKTLARMASSHYEHNGIRTAVFYINDDGNVFPVEREVPDIELAVHWSDIQESYRKSRETARPSLPVIGPYCTTLYCPHAAMCPATMNTIEGIDARDSKSTETRDYANNMFYETPLDSEHAGWMAARLKAVARAQKYYEGHLKDWIKLGNKAKWNGYEFVQTPRGFMLKKADTGCVQR